MRTEAVDHLCLLKTPLLETSKAPSPVLLPSLLATFPQSLLAGSFATICLIVCSPPNLAPNSLDVPFLFRRDPESLSWLLDQVHARWERHVGRDILNSFVGLMKGANAVCVPYFWAFKTVCLRLWWQMECD